MLEMLLCTAAICLVISYTVCWLMKREIVSLQKKLADAKADAIKSVEEFTEMQNEMRAACLQVTKERDQIKTDYNYIQECLWGEAETSYHLQCSRAVIIDHCRKLKRAIGHDRFAHKIEIDAVRDVANQMKEERDRAKKDFENELECFWEEYATSCMLRYSRDTITKHCRKLKRELANEKRAAEHLSSECYTLTKQHDAAIAERDHARKLMDETRERCGAEIDVLEETVGDFARKKADLYLAYMLMRQSRQKIIEHCRTLKRSQKDLRNLTDYILDELTTINTSR